jgi:hypothetical protein
MRRRYTLIATSRTEAGRSLVNRLYDEAATTEDSEVKGLMTDLRELTSGDDNFHAIMRLLDQNARRTLDFARVLKRAGNVERKGRLNRVTTRAVVEVVERALEEHTLIQMAAAENMQIMELWGTGSEQQPRHMENRDYSYPRFPQRPTRFASATRQQDLRVRRPFDGQP